MRDVGKRVAHVLQDLVGMVRPGLTLNDLDRRAEELTKQLGCVPAFKGYLGYRHSLCTSVNEQIVHGIPSDRALEAGDIVGLDFGLVREGFYGDSAITVPVPPLSAPAKELMETTARSLYAAIDASRAGNTLRDVAKAIEDVVAPKGFGIVKEFVGHGIGRKLHEDPQVANYVAGASNLKLRPGMTIAIEPMVNRGSAKMKILEDRWTAVTIDGSLSAHYEHSIAIREEGPPEVLTEWEGGGKYSDILQKLAGISL